VGCKLLDLQAKCNKAAATLKIPRNWSKTLCQAAVFKEKPQGYSMHFTVIASLLAMISLPAVAAPTWQTISSEPGKRIELDSTTLKREEGGKVLAQGRIILEKELIDPRSGAGYRIIEAMTRYDCGTRSANTIKRTYKKNETDVIREEEIRGADLPVRTGTLDDKVLREVCRPPKESPAELAQKANDAATQLKAANEALLKKELAKAPKTPPVKAADNAEAKAESPIPSIRPNLKPTEAPKEVAPPPAPTAKAATEPRNRGTVTVQTRATKPAPAPKASKEGYMLEIAHNAAVNQHFHTHWSYEGEGGPANWAKLDPKNKLCASGERQSPIDIRDGIKVDVEPIQFEYRPSTFRIIDNGHTVHVEVGDSSFTLTGKTYELQNIHFHRPSEERINGRAFDMVAHLVHKSYDGQLAVIAVLLEKGNEHPFIQTLWNNLPLEKKVAVSPPDPVVNPMNLLPDNRNYFAYMGSLTTPPCSEGVLWLVMKQPVQVSADQIAIFSRLYRNNARPIQPTNGRLVKEGR
jgi:carbonic anhydrase